MPGAGGSRHEFHPSDQAEPGDDIQGHIARENVVGWSGPALKTKEHNEGQGQQQRVQHEEPVLGFGSGADFAECQPQAQQHAKCRDRCSPPKQVVCVGSNAAQEGIRIQPDGLHAGQDREPRSLQGVAHGVAVHLIQHSPRRDPHTRPHDHIGGRAPKYPQTERLGGVRETCPGRSPIAGEGVNRKDQYHQWKDGHPRRLGELSEFRGRCGQNQQPRLTLPIQVRHHRKQ